MTNQHDNAGKTLPVVWGVLGASRFALKKSVPRMRKSARTEVRALASRSIEKAQSAANALSIPRAYGSYEELLRDPEIEAVYIPLPNHLHAEWTARAIRHGKHVLCEKPLAVNSAQVETLLALQQEASVLVAEAFMVRFHPQWQSVRELIASGRIGELRSLSYSFSYHNTDAENIRNIRSAGGGALLDLGCYAVNTARWLFDAEPLRVFAFCDRDPKFLTDRLTSAVMEFPTGHATFMCSTQLVDYERVHVVGTLGRIEIEVPFKSPPDHRCRIRIDDGRDVFESGCEIVEFAAVDQFELQAEQFSEAVRTGGRLENTLSDAIAGMRVIDALMRSMESGGAEVP